MKPYEELKKSLASGWNTWNTRSVLSHVLLPEGFAINLGLKEYRDSRVLREALIGRFGEDDEKVRPGPHAYDGSYTRLELVWQGIRVVVESAAVGGADLVLLVTPLELQVKPPVLFIEGGVLWNRPGWVRRERERLSFISTERTVDIYVTGAEVFEPNLPTVAPYLSVALGQPVGVSTGAARTVEEIRSLIEAGRARHEAALKQYGEHRDSYESMQTCIAWDTIYEPQRDRVVTPVSRLWNVRNGGYILFCWDNYFAAYMAFDHKALAYSNAIEITRAKTADGFVPNFSSNDRASLDRSQPPVGSMVVRELYRRYREVWLLEEVYDDLFEWNTWLYQNRHVGGGLMAWGSNPRPVVTDNYWESVGINDTFGGALESGLDNSPMYDEATFDPDRHVMNLADVGLMSLYVMDCAALADIAAVLNKMDDRAMLIERGRVVTGGLAQTWNGEFGLCLNKRLDTGAFSFRISPTNFYAMQASGWSSEQIYAMLHKHFYNPQEFWGDYILPSIARNDPAYADQDYWRGRIWAPMNFLVYLAMRRYEQTAKACADLAKKSLDLLMKEWRALGHVHENYNGATGEGCDVHNSDKYYHWGALLAMISLIEAGVLPGPEQPL